MEWLSEAIAPPPFPPVRSHFYCSLKKAIAFPKLRDRLSQVMRSHC
ncbi:MULTISPECIES: hypothetical protein [Spirulina sp. CCY15215]|nr:hypothetical protein [Spirulina major]